MTIKPCNTCNHCVGDVLAVFAAKCTAVVNPVTGAPMGLPEARCDTSGGLNLPCGYAGNLWQAKP